MKKKLTFFSFGEDTFLQDLIIGLRPKYNTKMFYRSSEQEFFQMYHDCDIAWFEWCDQLIINAMQHPKMGQKVICRFHSYELFTDMPKHVDWNKVDRVIFVSEVVRDLAVSKFGIPPHKTIIINNGVNTDKYQIPADKQYNKKVAFVGLINYKKGIETLMHTFEQLYLYDDKLEFHIAGQHQDERIALYMDWAAYNMPYKIHFDGWVNDISEYLKDKDYIISTSLFESFQYSIAEGMSQGLVPLVYNWRGSELIYPKDYIFNTIKECVDIVKDFEVIEDKSAVRQKLRNHIVDNFSLEKQLDKTIQLLESL